MGVGGQYLTLVALPPVNIPGTPYTGGCVFPKDGLDRYDKPRPHRDSTPARSARSELLYRLLYPVPHVQ
jgi:hypothetical protein